MQNIEISQIATLPTRHGIFLIQAFKEPDAKKEHLAVFTKSLPELETPIVRVHSECLTGDAIGSIKCDCGEQLDFALNLIAKEGGLVIYHRQEGRNIGLLNKVNAYTLQDQGLDTVAANHQLGFRADERTYEVVAFILCHFGITKLKLLTNNLTKMESLSDIEIVERLPIKIAPNPYNEVYLKTKKRETGAYSLSKELEKRLLEEGLFLNINIIEKLQKFTLLLHEWNQIHNLTGAKTIRAIHDNIIDSLYPLTFIKEPKILLDVGTGSGFPGLVLAIAMPETKVVLAEPLKKRVSFLKYAIIDVDIPNVTVEAKQVEKVTHAPFSLISSRAVTNTKLLLELTQHLSDTETQYLFYKGSRVFDEIDDVQHQLGYDIVQKNQRNYLYIKGYV